MRTTLSSAAIVLSLLAGGCPKRAPADPAATSAPAPTVAKTLEPASSEPEPEPEPKAPPAPFDWTRTITDDEHLLAVAVGQRAKRFAPPGPTDVATPEVVLHTDPTVKARAVYREDPKACGGDEGDVGDCTGRWSLEITVAKERWQIADFATWITDCAGIDDGFGRDSMELAARDLVSGGPQELVITARESHSTYPDECNCTTRAGSSEHVWACGLVPEGKGWRPVCWAHVERARDVGPSMDPEDCACAANVSREAWAIEAELVPPGRVVVTHEGRTDEHELATLPCGLASPPKEFACITSTTTAAGR